MLSLPAQAPAVSCRAAIIVPDLPGKSPVIAVLLRVPHRSHHIDTHRFDMARWLSVLR
ncbi:hypothetical protein ABID19_001155 [Mesorhizobium robiniae]|uniref:Uncharacterized protein n=1 Tax=Mesorhizobium robiniae TaxID=559315 RepID=A0ABV2GIR3_9HYPH